MHIADFGAEGAKVVDGETLRLERIVIHISTLGDGISPDPPLRLFKESLAPGPFPLRDSVKMVAHHLECDYAHPGDGRGDSDCIYGEFVILFRLEDDLHKLSVRANVPERPAVQKTLFAEKVLLGGGQSARRVEVTHDVTILKILQY